MDTNMTKTNADSQQAQEQPPPPQQQSQQQQQPQQQQQQQHHQHQHQPQIELSPPPESLAPPMYSPPTTVELSQPPAQQRAQQRAPQQPEPTPTPTPTPPPPPPGLTPRLRSFFDSADHVRKQAHTKKSRFDFLRRAEASESSVDTVVSTEPIVPATHANVDENKAVLAMLVDRSGSMQTMGNEVSGGCNEYLKTQRTSDVENNTETHVLFSTFDTSYELVRSGSLKDQPTISDVDVRPRGGTALYDSIARLIADTIALINKMDEGPAQVGVFILTDGEENSSHVWSQASIAQQIKLLESAPHNWQFYFAAANQDAMVTGRGIGMSPGRCVTYENDSDNMKRAFHNSSEAFTRQRQYISSDYTQLQRADCTR